MPTTLFATTMGQTHEISVEVPPPPVSVAKGSFVVAVDLSGPRHRAASIEPLAENRLSHAGGNEFSASLGTDSFNCPSPSSCLVAEKRRALSTGRLSKKTAQISPTTTTTATATAAAATIISKARTLVSSTTIASLALIQAVDGRDQTTAKMDHDVRRRDHGNDDLFRLSNNDDEDNISSSSSLSSQASCFSSRASSPVQGASEDELQDAEHDHQQQILANQMSTTLPSTTRSTERRSFPPRPSSSTITPLARHDAEVDLEGENDEEDEDGDDDDDDEDEKDRQHSVFLTRRRLRSKETAAAQTLMSPRYSPGVECPPSPCPQSTTALACLSGSSSTLRKPQRTASSSSLLSSKRPQRQSATSTIATLPCTPPASSSPTALYSTTSNAVNAMECDSPASSSSATTSTTTPTLTAPPSSPLASISSKPAVLVSANNWPKTVAEASTLYGFDTSIKPVISYASLIGQAIAESAEGRLTLCDIYAWIMDRHPYYRYCPPGWQNSIRHNLSLNKAFLKLERNMGEPGKGCFWKLHKNAWEYIDNSPPKAAKKKMAATTAATVATNANLVDEPSTASTLDAPASTSANTASNSVDLNTLEVDPSGAGGPRRSGRARRPPRPKEAEEILCVSTTSSAAGSGPAAMSTPPASPAIVPVHSGSNSLTDVDSASANKRHSCPALSKRNSREVLTPPSTAAVASTGSTRIRRPPQNLSEFVVSRDVKTSHGSNNNSRRSSRRSTSRELSVDCEPSRPQPQSQQPKQQQQHRRIKSEGIELLPPNSSLNTLFSPLTTPLEPSLVAAAEASAAAARRAFGDHPLVPLSALSHNNLNKHKKRQSTDFSMLMGKGSCTITTTGTLTSSLTAGSGGVSPLPLNSPFMSTFPSVQGQAQMARKQRRLSKDVLSATTHDAVQYHPHQQSLQQPQRGEFPPLQQRPRSRSIRSAQTLREKILAQRRREGQRVIMVASEDDYSDSDADMHLPKDHPANHLGHSKGLKVNNDDGDEECYDGLSAYERARKLKADEEMQKLLSDRSVIHYGFECGDSNYILNFHQSPLFNCVSWPEFSHQQLLQQQQQQQHQQHQIDHALEPQELLRRHSLTAATVPPTTCPGSITVSTASTTMTTTKSGDAEMDMVSPVDNSLTMPWSLSLLSLGSTTMVEQESKCRMVATEPEMGIISSGLDEIKEEREAEEQDDKVAIVATVPSAATAVATPMEEMELDFEPELGLRDLLASGLQLNQLNTPPLATSTITTSSLPATPLDLSALTLSMGEHSGVDAFNFEMTPLVETTSKDEDFSWMIV